MRTFMAISFWLIFISYSFGQDKMIINKPYDGSTVYDGFSEQITSVAKLPTLIQFNLNGYLKRVLGGMSDSVTFSHGQIVDLPGYFKADSSTFGYGWIVPKYDLSFVLRDESICIKCYYLKITLDEYGQILSCNWPKDDQAYRRTFKNPKDIERFAIRQALSKGFDTTGYTVDFVFEKKSDRLCWVFDFPLRIEKNRSSYNVLGIPWNSLEVVEEGQTLKSIQY